MSLSPFDTAFARLMCRLEGRESPELMLAASLVAGRTAGGDVCLDLPSLARGELSDLPEVEIPASVEPWMDALRKTKVVGEPGKYRPLVLDGAGRLYLYRYWKYESDLARNLDRMARGQRSDYSPELLAEGLGRMFGSQSSDEPDLQRLAAAVAVMRSLCVISGGPGTGKTSTVVRVLALLAEQALARGVRIRAALAAPTGKAAVRLQEAVSGALHKLPCSPETRESVPTSAQTLHRLLGSLPGSPYFRHNADNPLPFDVVVVDESSMADLPLMAKLVDALSPECRLILLGDRDQLSSVEAGAVLGDICGIAVANHYSEEFAKLVSGPAGFTPPSLSDARPIADSIVILKKSYRFDESGGIGALAAAIREGSGEEALRILREGGEEVGIREDVRAETVRPALLESMLSHLASTVSAEGPIEAFERMGVTALLCALRRGPLGVSGINEAAERMLRRQGLINPNRRWYPGRPIMVMRNDYSLGLYNGDMGMVLDGEDGPRAYFPDLAAGARDVIPRLLPEHETVYAMTVHKSQGSEFDRVVLVLPEIYSPVLTRELVYTGVTRARASVEVWSPPEIFVQAVKTPVRRASGLREALWG